MWSTIDLVIDGTWAWDRSFLKQWPKEDSSGDALVTLHWIQLHFQQTKVNLLTSHASTERIQMQFCEWTNRWMADCTFAWILLFWSTQAWFGLGWNIPSPALTKTMWQTYQIAVTKSCYLFITCFCSNTVTNAVTNKSCDKNATVFNIWCQKLSTILW